MVFRLKADLHSGCGFTRLARIIMLAAACGAVSFAQTTPYAEFQYSTITGTGDTITVTRLPVVTSTGTTYVNVVVQFDVAADGTLTISSGYPQIVASPSTLIHGFLAGNYTGPSADSGYDITVSSPGVTAAGATEWSLATSASATCNTTPTTATWYVFGGSMTKNPLYPRLKAAGITQQIYASYGGWGTTGTQVCGGGIVWGSNTLIGLSQTGKALAITSFTYNGGDKNQPQDMIAYTKN